MIEIQQRIQRAVESILDNEALTADLDDQAARVLLDWGVGLTQQIVGQTLEMDEAQAEQATYQPMRALRKMLRSANKWANAPGEKNLRKVLDQAPNVYGSRYRQPSDQQLGDFMAQIPSTPLERVTALQRFVNGEEIVPAAGKEPMKEPDTARGDARRASHKKIDGC
jgi:hypothetical protein